MPVLEISRDVEELERAALALMEWSAKSLAMPEQVKHLVREPEISDAHRGWLEYLFRFERQGGPELKARADVVEGVNAIRRARSSFKRRYKPCACGKWVPTLTKLCLCGNKF